jgi:hypothetical protein
MEYVRFTHEGSLQQWIVLRRDLSRAIREQPNHRGNLDDDSLHIAEGRMGQVCSTQMNLV